MLKIGRYIGSQKNIFHLKPYTYKNAHEKFKNTEKYISVLDYYLP